MIRNCLHAAVWLLIALLAYANVQDYDQRLLEREAAQINQWTGERP